jgi:dTDP-D-glucose 4,6-dehydratase
LDVEIATICDKKRLEQIFEEHKPQLIYHAAAHKHVPLMENNPEEAIKNNIFGTYNVVMCADKYGVEKFIQIREGNSLVLLISPADKTGGGNTIDVGSVLVAFPELYYISE